MIKRFGVNTAGRDFIVGDIHGCFAALQTALDRIDFDGSKDRLFSVGDLVDRGQESKSSIDWLAKPWFHAVAGNHELMAVMYAEGQIDSYMYAQNGGAWFIGMTPDERTPYIDAFKSLPIAMGIDTSEGLIGVVHAECPVSDWNDLSEALAGDHAEAFINMCVWSRDRITNNFANDVQNVRAVVCGHTPVQQITKLGNVHYIDTGAVFRGGRLTILDAKTLAEATPNWAAANLVSAA